MYAPVHARIHAQEQHRNEIKGPTTLRVRTFKIRLKSEKTKTNQTIPRASQCGGGLIFHPMPVSCTGWF